MEELKKMIITDISETFIVHSEKGRQVKIKDREFFGISLCKSGQITYSMNGKEFVSDPTCAVFHPKGADYLLFGEKEGFFPVINFEAEELSCNELKVIPLQDPAGCQKLYESLERAEGHLAQMSVFYRLLDSLFAKEGKEQGVLSPALAYIEENLSSPELSNEGLARLLKISEGYLRKLFQKNLQTTPKQYILDQRMKRARQLLLNTSWSVTAIAEKCGFSSVYHFCRAFRAHSGLTPTQYAQMNRIFKI